MATYSDLNPLLAAGESDTLEFKKSTAELRRVGQTLCSFLNGNGGMVLIGVSPDGKAVGQHVGDDTLRDIAGMLGRFEPAARVELERIPVEGKREVIVLAVAAERDYVPYASDGRPCKRIGSTTSVMPQEEYARLLLDRTHSRQRWENQIAFGVTLDDLDREEILRTRQTAIEQRRLSAGTSMDSGDILDRLSLRVDGQITNAAQILYGTQFQPYYSQGLLKLGRFRGTAILGDILDNKQEHMHAFAMVREAMAWLDRTLPIASQFPTGGRLTDRILRKDRLPVPADALREIIINAVIHRDLSNGSSYVAIAVFDDRIEVSSYGDLPTGVRPEMLAQDHKSKPRNPLIAGAFHRTGAIEVWGRGTNRVIDACRADGLADPIFSTEGGFVTVTFPAQVVADVTRVASAGTELVHDPNSDPADPAPSRHQVGTKSALSQHQVRILEVAQLPKTLAELMEASGRSDRTKFRHQVLRPLLDAGLLEMTVPEKPRSSNQKYRRTIAGKARCDAFSG